jgi:hypothetical protein
MNTPVRVDVRDRAIERVTDLRTGAEVAASPYARWPTVDSLFAWTRDLIENKQYRVTARYDVRYGFPTLVSGDIPMAIDDEITYTARALVAR